jgi:hypothetical protein
MTTINTKNILNSNVERCGICLENSTYKLECGHIFHEKCMEQWKQYNSCPICRCPLDSNFPVKKPISNTEGDEDLATELLYQDAVETVIRQERLEILLESLRYNEINADGCQCCGKSEITLNELCYTCGVIYFCSDDCKNIGHVCSNIILST